MKSVYQTSKIEKALQFSSAGLFVLAALCFMVYTTEQHYTYAEGDEDLGYDIASANASVTVGTACTFTGTVTSPHTATIANGINSTDIGTTVLNTTCNDSGGYALYAIGFAGDEYGATDLSYTSLDGTTTNSDYNIATGTATSGNTSNWSMKLSPVAGTTTATIENSYSSYNIVPDDYTKVATLSTVTDPGSSTSGSSVSTTYSAYISPTQPAGTYTGKVKYTLVHPSTAPAPEIPPTYMQDTVTIKAKLTNVGDTMQAVDSRDGKSYWVAKLADGNIWMTQNLDLDIEAGRTYTSADTDLANSTIGTSWTPTVSTSTTSSWTSSKTAPSSYNPGELYWDGTLNTDWDGNLSNETVSDPSATSGGTHYHVGNYYNWTAAVAMSDSSSYITDQQDVNQSICPAGWRLPTYSGDKSYLNLKNTQGFTVGTSGNIQNSPVYFVYGGDWRGSSSRVGGAGFYWSSVVGNRISAYQLRFDVDVQLDPQFNITRNTGYSLRCVAR